MRGTTCTREDAVLAAALEAPRSPLSAELAEHLAACDSCRDLHIIAAALQDDQAEALADVRVPSAGQAWWRAEIRARQEAAVVAARPITVAAGLAAACLVGVLASVAGVLVWWLQDSLAIPATHVLGSGLSGATWAVPTGMRLLVWLVAGALCVVTPLVLYVALREE
jgi:predicted anti-sigma-YlaC factor YlaD